jgi:hypothetical protein
LPNQLSAQTPKFYLSTDKSRIQAGETFLLEVILENMDSKNLKMPDLAPFKILQGPSTSSSVSIINGRKTSSYTYQYLLLANARGNFNIGPATVSVGAQTIKSNTLNIEVSAASFNNTIFDKEADKETFLRLESSAVVGYKGQQIVLDYVLYTRQNLESYNILNEPDFEGFFAQPINDLSGRPGRKTINGKEYYTQTIRRIVLYPQKTGKYAIGPVNCTIDVIVENGRSSFFFQDTRKQQITTNSLKIDIKDLPQTAPTTFSGAVGEFTMKASVNKSVIGLGETIVIKMEIEGDGDPKVVQPPKFDLPTGLEKYEPSITKDETFSRSDKIQMLKQFEFNFVPTQDTVINIRPEFSYFSTSTGKYTTITAGPFNIKVVRGQTTVSANDNTQIDDDLSVPSDDYHTFDTSRGLWGSGLFYGLFGLICLITISGIYIKKKKSENSISTAKKLQSAGNVAMQNLSKAEKFKMLSDYSGFYEELSAATTGYIMRRYNIPQVDAGFDAVAGYLRRNNIPEHLIALYGHIRQKCELARFAGQYSGYDELFDQAVQLITTLENQK